MGFREAVLLIAAIAVARLILLKSDQQSVVLLEGRLFGRGRDPSIAANIFTKHKRSIAAYLFMLGGAGIAISVMLLAKKEPLFWLSAAATVVVLCLGIGSRIRSFRAADRDLDALTKETRSIMTYNSSFQDRAAQAANAKQKALDQLRSRPQLDAAAAAQRAAAGEAKEAAKAEKAAAKKAERKAGKDAAAADAEAKAAASAPKSEADLKAARDARYAKRKAKK